MRPVTAIGAVACAVALAACGEEDDIGVPVPDGAREEAVDLVWSTMDEDARREDVPGPQSVRCQAVADVVQRPIGKQYDHHCTVTFPNGATIECVVPPASGGGMACNGVLLADPPWPGVYTVAGD